MRHIVIIVLSLLTFWSCAEKEKPNILFIMSDDHTWQAISAYNSILNSTPNIDRLAKEGMLFQNSFVTNSICAPSRAVMLTGKLSHENGVIDNDVVFDGSQQTFPKLLQQAGYQTALIGKWHLKSHPTGFDYWKVLPDQGDYYHPEFIEMGQEVQDSGYVTNIITENTLQWLESMDVNKPFCMLMHHKAPHRNWLPEPEKVGMFNHIDFPVPETFFDKYENRGSAAREQEMSVFYDMQLSYDMKVKPKYLGNHLSKEEIHIQQIEYDNFFNRMTQAEKENWDKHYEPGNQEFYEADLSDSALAVWKYQRYMRDYLSCIASVDESIGEVLDYLEETGLAKNTIVVYTSDQGFYLGEHGWFDKRMMYEESYRTPFLIRYPKEIRAGKRNLKDMIMNLDYAATFLDFAGIEKPSDMQGESFREILNGKTPSDWRHETYYHYFEYPAIHMVKRHYGIRTQKYKLIHFYYDCDEWELYDLEKDPAEMNNEYNNPAYADIKQDLFTRLQKLREEYNDTDIDQFKPQSQQEVDHLAVGSKVSLSHATHTKYSGGADNALCDGIKSPDKIQKWEAYSIWSGFEGNDMEAVIELRTQQEISKIRMGFLQAISSWIFAPEYIETSYSLDGINYKLLEKTSNTHDLKDERLSKIEVIHTFDTKEAKYIKVKAKNIGQCPNWHKGAGGPAFLFADEIEVR